MDLRMRRSDDGGAPSTPEGPPPALLARPVYAPPTAEQAATGDATPRVEHGRAADRRTRLISRILHSARSSYRRPPTPRVAIPLPPPSDAEPPPPPPTPPPNATTPAPAPAPPGSEPGGAEEGDGARRTAGHYVRIIASYRTRLQQSELLTSYKQTQLDSMRKYVGDLETTVTTLLQARDRAARASRALRHRASVAEDKCQSQGLRHALTTSNLHTMRSRIAALETQFVDTLALLRETQQMVHGANEHADETERRGCCAVCLNARADTVVLSCRHCVMCQACCEELLERAPESQPARCTVCRDPFDASGVMRILLP